MGSIFLVQMSVQKMFSCKMFNLLICLCLALSWCSASRHVTMSSEPPSPCPTWMYRQSLQDKGCTCGNDLHDAVTCLSDKYSAYVIKGFCIVLSEENSTALIGTCPYSTGGKLPKNISDAKDFGDLYFPLQRRGQLCGACEENYTLPVYSYYLGCFKCEDYKYGWVKFIAAAFVPLTFFYILIIVFRISGTSSTLNGFILVSQIIGAPSVIHEIYSYNQANTHYHVHSSSQLGINIGTAIYGIWNLDFFRSFYKPICLSPDLRYQHVLLLDYAVAVYPLLLIFITFICVKLHDNFAIVVWLWRPFHKCLVRFRRQWNIRSYLVNALATFIVLSYVKILNVSFQFLISSLLYDINGHLVHKSYWYYDGRVDMTSKEYLPYLLLALSMLLIFNIFPLVLLTLYPFKFFQHCLNCLPCTKYKLALQLFMDAFNGCYKDNDGHDYRHFAALYLAVRFFNLLLLSVLRSTNAYCVAATLLTVFALTLVAKFQPYKRKSTNTVDIVMLLTLITGLVIVALWYTSGLRYPKWLFGVSLSIVGLLPPSYIVYLAVAHFKPKISRCFRRIRTLFLRQKRNKPREDSEDSESTLLNHGNAGYNTFTSCTTIDIQ